MAIGAGWRHRPLLVLAVGVVVGFAGSPVASAATEGAAQGGTAAPVPVVLEPDLAPQTGFGEAVAVDGDTMVVGADASAGFGGPDRPRGGAAVYVASDDTWVLQDRLTASGVTKDDVFGHAVAVDGDTAIVTAPLTDRGGVSEAGAAYVFVRSGSTWTQQAKLVPSAPEAHANFGLAVALQGDQIVVGQPGAADSGVAVVFTRSGTTWTEQAVLHHPEGDAEQEPHNFGWALALDGDTLVVGSFTYALRPRRGAAYVYVGAGASWTRQAVLTSSTPGGGIDDTFGSKVDIDGDTVAVGAESEDVGDSFAAGAAHVFERSGSTWSHTARLVATDTFDGERLGWALAIKGRDIALGAPFGLLTNQEKGRVILYRQAANGTWRQSHIVQAPVPTYRERYGFALDMDETESGQRILAVGAPHSNGPRTNDGAVYIYRR